MKAVKNFLSFVEIRTKIASVFPFLVGTGYTLYRYGAVRPGPAMLFFASMLLFDLTTTALNNHVGHRQTGRKPHYSGAASISIILSMGILAAVLGVFLVLVSGVMILLVGVFCFGTGILYNFGPLPLSRTPFGELFSGTVMGICIPFIAVEINRPIIHMVVLPLSRVVLTADWAEALRLGIVVTPLVCCIANIMLANNICDVQEDAAVQRYTLPFYIGVKRSLLLYQLLYGTAYVFILVAAALRILPIFTGATLLTLIPVRRNIQAFIRIQDKNRTFRTAVLNFWAILLPYTAFIWLGCVTQLY